MAERKKTKEAEAVKPDEVDELRERIRAIIKNAGSYAAPPCRDDQEVADRSAEYVAKCEAKATMLPTCEAYAMYLGASLHQLKKWKNGKECSQEKMETVQGIITWISVIWMDARQKGLLKPADFIWYSKQWFEMREPDVHAVVDVVDPRRELPSAASVADKYLEDVGVKGLPNIKPK